MWTRTGVFFCRLKCSNCLLQFLDQWRAALGVDHVYVTTVFGYVMPGLTVWEIVLYLVCNRDSCPDALGSRTDLTSGLNTPLIDFFILLLDMTKTCAPEHRCALMG